MATDWNRWGRVFYAMQREMIGPGLTWEVATPTVVVALVGELLALPKAERDAALDAATEGYVAAHGEAEGLVD